MKDCDLYWLAGYFEGEGCFHIGKRRNNGESTSRPISASLVSVDKDVIEKAASIIGVDPKTPNRRTVTGKQVYTVWLCGTKAVDLMKLLLPHMGQRRAAKIREVIEAFNNRPGCPWGETNGHAKLTVDKVIELRGMSLPQPQGTWARLARKWNVSQTSLYYALHGRSWKKVCTLTKA